MTIAVDLGRKATKQTKRNKQIKIIVFIFAYTPEKTNYLRVGRIKFIYITIEVISLCNQLFLKIISKIKLYTDIYMHMQRMTHYLFQLLNRVNFIFSVPFIVYLMKLLVHLIIC